MFFLNSEKTLHAIAVIRSSSEYEDLSSYKNPNESHLIINENSFYPEFFNFFMITIS